jgi:hypothetical protein
MKQYAPGFAIYREALGFIALVSAAIGLLHLDTEALYGIGFVVISLALAGVIPVELPRGVVVDISPGFDITGALMLGPAGATASFVGRLLAVLAEAVGQGRGLRVKVSDMDTPDVIATVVAGYVSVITGFSGLHGLTDILTAAKIGVAYFLVRWLITGVSDGLRYNLSVGSAARSFFKESGVATLLQLGAGLFGAYVYGIVPFNWVSLLMFAVFAALVAYAAILYIEMRAVYWTTLLALIPAIEAEANYDEGHSYNVAVISVAMARKMLLAEQTVRGVYIGALMHDVGMAGIDERVLNKPGRLTDEEKAQVSMHVAIGSKIIEKVPFLRPASGIVQHHHERWDGDGYPDGISGSAIPVGARIVAVADAFEALVSKRPYREAHSTESALEEIRRCAGQQFDPNVVKALEAAVPDAQRWGRSVFQQHYSVDIAR